MNVFSRAAQGLDLTPSERAALKLLKGLLISAILAGVAAAYPYLVTANASPNWGQAAHVGFVALLMTIIAAVDKYVTAHTDPTVIEEQPTPATVVTNTAANNTTQPTPVSAT